MPSWHCRAIVADTGTRGSGSYPRCRCCLKHSFSELLVRCFDSPDQGVSSPGSPASVRPPWYLMSSLGVSAPGPQAIGSASQWLVVDHVSQATLSLLTTLPRTRWLTKLPYPFSQYPLHLLTTCEHASDTTQRPFVCHLPPDAHRHVTQRANDCDGTSHSDPITTVIQALRPNVLLRTPPVWVNTTKQTTSLSGSVDAPAVWATH